MSDNSSIWFAIGSTLFICENIGASKAMTDPNTLTPALRDEMRRAAEGCLHTHSRAFRSICSAANVLALLDALTAAEAARDAAILEMSNQARASLPGILDGWIERAKAAEARAAQAERERDEARLEADGRKNYEVVLTSDRDAAEASLAALRERNAELAAALGSLLPTLEALWRDFAKLIVEARPENICDKCQNWLAEDECAEGVDIALCRGEAHNSSECFARFPWRHRETSLVMLPFEVRTAARVLAAHHADAPEPSREKADGSGAHTRGVT